ncbi:GNAT family N-acetyltransferase [Brachybacterium sp.]|uniref:GNAT family N-acetyltransferase n=1 Tax=Brachybacterium sp. TaxID=1891286 RepID=UPI002ED16B58
MLAQWSREQLSERLRIGRAPGGAPAGFLTVGPSRDEEAPRPLELQALNVDSAFHGTGLAQALMRDLLQERPAYLWVVEENPRARRFYEKEGFRADGGLKVDADLGDLREIRMTR